MKTVKTFVAVLFAVTSAFGDDVKPDDFYALDGTQKYVAKARVEYARPEFCGDYYTNTLFAANSKFYKLSKGDKDKKIPWQPGMVKWFNVDGTKNVRDCGGWNGLKEGMLFRGAQLDKPEAVDKNNPDKKRQYDTAVTPEGVRVLRDVMKIKCDFDLRGDSAGLVASPIGADVRHPVFPISAYVNCVTRQKKGGTLNRAIQAFADPGNFPMYVHCAGGADRTGTVCFIVEALCGVCEADLSIEYELTTVGLATRKRTDGPYFFASMVKHFKGFPGATLGEKVKNYCLSIGVTEAEIEAIRKNLMNSQN